MPLLEAVHATRIHHQWTPDALSFESDSLDADVKQALTSLGHKLTPIETIGDVQAAQRLSDGGIVGVSDSRGEGMPAVP
jgi:gamma-glutamyltranspeptidase/glutathione hydrolase